MKKLWLALIVILAAMSLFIAACGDDDDNNNITNPEDAEWVITLFQIPDNLRAGFMFEAWWNGESTGITEADVFTATIGGTNIPLESYYYGGEWVISGYDFPLQPGTEYEVKFFKNDNQIVAKTVKTCYPVSCTFPGVYNPAETLTLNWNLSNNNQAQFVSISSTNYPTNTEYDEELYQVSNASRSYTIPANAVQDMGVGTDYELGILEYNNYISGTCYLSTTQGVGASYESMLSAKIQRLERARKQAL